MIGLSSPPEASQTTRHPSAPRVTCTCAGYVIAIRSCFREERVKVSIQPLAISTPITSSGKVMRSVLDLRDLSLTCPSQASVQVQSRSADAPHATKRTSRPVTGRGRVWQHLPERSTRNNLGQHGRLTNPAVSDDDRPDLRCLCIDPEMMPIAPVTWPGRPMFPDQPRAIALAPVLSIRGCSAPVPNRWGM
jgi:hypothetical protein